ncbi:MAG: hypothetical protein ACLQBA_22470 [Candidatus Binataceae bacterium]
MFAAALAMIVIGVISVWLGTLDSILALAGLTAVAFMRAARYKADGGTVGRVLQLAQLVILDQNGKPRLGLDSTGFQLLDDKGRARILMAVDGDGPAVQVCDGSGKLQLSLGSSAADGSYGLSLLDQQGKVRARAVMRNEDQGIASFGVYDPSGQIRANLCIGGRGQATLNFADEAGGIIWSAPDASVAIQK